MSVPLQAMPEQGARRGIAEESRTGRARKTVPVADTSTGRALEREIVSRKCEGWLTSYSGTVLTVHVPTFLVRYFSGRDRHWAVDVVTTVALLKHSSLRALYYGVGTINSGPRFLGIVAKGSTTWDVMLYAVTDNVGFTRWW